MEGAINNQHFDPDFEITECEKLNDLPGYDDEETGHVGWACYKIKVKKISADTTNEAPAAKGKKVFEHDNIHYWGRLEIARNEYENDLTASDITFTDWLNQNYKKFTN